MNETLIRILCDKCGKRQYVPIIMDNSTFIYRAPDGRDVYLRLCNDHVAEFRSFVTPARARAVRAGIERVAQYAQRIRGAVAAWEMHQLAIAAADDDRLSAGDRSQLQLLFAARSRELWPETFIGRRR